MVSKDIASGSPSPRGTTYDLGRIHSRLSAVVHDRKSLPSRLCGAIQHSRSMLSTSAPSRMPSFCRFGQSAWSGSADAATASPRPAFPVKTFRLGSQELTA